jgi:predicted  nucleic acid-binding Zn-ribbon protein
MRLEEINQKKKELIPVRESLAKERERLNAEAKAQGTVVSPDVAESYRKKFNDIDAKINSFNKEIKKLNEEEQNVLHDMGRSPKSMK